MCIRFYDRLEDLLSNAGYQSFQLCVIYVGTLCGVSQCTSRQNLILFTIMVNVFPLPV